ncbi:MAG: hypothetical protein HY071_01750 [Chloroflexi bacterium]|nr:hypothetical protein [Chloroflexota bacterium]
MRVIFETQPVPTVAIVDEQGVKLKGTSHFKLLLFDPGEAVVEPHTKPYSAKQVAEWLGTVASGEPIRMGPPPSFIGAEPVVIPRALLDALPISARLVFNWSFSRS